MSLKQSIIQTLDSHGYDSNKTFIWLDHVYSYLVDCRLNVFKGKGEKWASVAERVGFNPREGNLVLEIYFYGNCLINLEKEGGVETNLHRIYLIENFEETTDFDILNADAKYWHIRGKKIPLEFSKDIYAKYNITLNEFEPNTVGVEEMARLLAVKSPSIFRATDVDLYKSVPSELEKILVLDEWFHKDYNAYFQSVEELKENKPSSYETWNLVAEVIEKGDGGLYKPTLSPNTHWSNYPDSGTY